jgi:hypothetical protein
MLLFLFLTLLNLGIFTIIIKSQYLEYIYHESYYYATREDYFFGIFAKYENLTTILLLYNIISYSIIIIKTFMIIDRDLSVLMKTKNIEKNN